MYLFNDFGSREAAAATLASAVATDIQAGVADNQAARVVLCGGTSPVEMFHSLASRPLGWGRVTVVPSDERWVPVDHEDSNEGLLNRTLLQGAAANARLLGLYRHDRDRADALADIDADISKLGGAFDHVVLGMGGDGHTASIFPHAVNVEAMLAARQRVLTPELPAGETPRVSLSLPSLLSARAISLLFFGADKRAVFERAAAGEPPATLPIAAILNNAPVPVRVFWAP